jgi:hypothetical protein
MVDEPLIHRYREDGAVVLRGLLDTTRVEQLRWPRPSAQSLSMGHFGRRILR